MQNVQENNSYSFQFFTKEHGFTKNFLFINFKKDTMYLFLEFRDEIFFIFLFIFMDFFFFSFISINIFN